MRALTLLTRRTKLFLAHYRIARGYTDRRNAATVAWQWALMLKAADGVAAAAKTSAETQPKGGA